MAKDENPFKYMPIDVSFFLLDDKVLEMSFEILGAYFWLLLLSWWNEGLPADENSRIALLKLSSSSAKSEILAKLKLFFLASEKNPSKLVNKRQEIIRNMVTGKHLSAAERGSKGGRSKAKAKLKRGAKLSSSSAILLPVLNIKSLISKYKELNTEEFKKEWGNWINYRKEAGLKKWKLITAKTKLAEMETWGHDAAIESIKRSIGNGWSGLFEPPSKHTGSSQRSAGSQTGEASRRRADQRGREFTEPDSPLPQI